MPENNEFQQGAMENQPEQSSKRPRPFNRPRRGQAYGPRRRPMGAASAGSKPRDEGDPPKQARPPVRPADDEDIESSGPESPATIADALREVESIRIKLEGVLEDVEHVLEILHRAEQEKMGSERELEQLRRSLRSLHRPSRERTGSPPPARHDDPPDEDQNS
jgi:hypothetical protein